MPIYWDDIELLKAIDQLEGEGRAHHMTGEDWIQLVAAGRQSTDEDRAAFVRLVHMLHGRGRLTLEQMAMGNIRPQPHEHSYLQSLWHFELTETGKDRAQGRIVFTPTPEPGEDDGRPIAGAILERFAVAIGAYYSTRQLEKLLDESGIASPNQGAKALGRKAAFAMDGLSQLEAGDIEQRRALRGLLAAVLNGEIDALPSVEEGNELKAALARAGWHLEGRTLIAGDPVRTEEPATQSQGKESIAAFDTGAEIFLVHGHDLGRLNEVARFIERISPKSVVILHEQPNQGQTLIEKFETNATRAAHTVVLLTADDRGRAKDTPDEQPRGRQNVVLELGFFFGKLGRKHVTVLRDPEVEEPSDMRGLVYLPLDKDGRWQLDLARELRAAGIEVDLNKLS
jgi:predicted nucleotide-binding protein